MEVDQELFRKLFALTETNTEQLAQVLERLDRIEKKVDGLDQRVTEGFAGVRQMFASLGVQEVRRTGTGDD